MAYITEYDSIRSHLLIKIHVPYYMATPTSDPTDTYLTFSDLNRDNSIDYDGHTFVGLGSLLAVTASNSEIKPSSSELTITISGIPNSSIQQITNSRIKGCTVYIYRGLFNATTGAILNLDQNPLARFRGFVNNYSIQEEYDVNNRLGKNTLLLICKSSLDVMQNKISGRLTNPTSWKKNGVTDPVMDRVPALQNVSFNFGAPK